MAKQSLLLPLEINGSLPDLSGKSCEGLLVRQYIHANVLVDPANIIHLKFGGQWHRLYFDCGIVFWRLSRDEPKSWLNPEEEWSYPLIDVAAQANVINVELERYLMSPVVGGSSVQFVFRNGKRIAFTDVNDHTAYQVI